MYVSIKGGRRPPWEFRRCAAPRADACLNAARCSLTRIVSADVTAGEDQNWRLTVKFESEGHAHGVFSALKTHAAAALAADKMKDGLVAQRDGEWLRVYAGSDEALRRAQAIVSSALEVEGVHAEEEAQHRASEAAEWQPVDLPPLPDRDAGLGVERHGKGPWGSEADPNRVQAHFELDSRHAAQSFAEQLASDGYDVQHAESFVFIFADDRAAAQRLGEELKQRAPASAQLFLEGEGRTLFI
jgi:hypothetical protein